ncbi:MAG: hypothetical protein JJU46_04575 [Balneolaceae bacterium]|nr:hypothetical protein [Balneolaceae bacterium]MCH8549335.1 phage baseplate assembly protein V [Balneolaceae bacterium]
MPQTTTQRITFPGAREADRSQIELIAGGVTLNRSLNPSSITIDSRLNQIPTATLRIPEKGNARNPFPNSGSRHFSPGNTIEIKEVTPNGDSSLFKGVVVKLNVSSNGVSSPELVVKCRHVSFRLDGTPASRTFSELSLSEIADHLAGQAGLKLENRTRYSTPTIPTAVQSRESDWQFLLRLASESGKLLFVEGEDLILSDPDLSSPRLTLQHGRDTLEFEAVIDASRQIGRITLSSWDSSQQKMVQVQSSEPDLPKAGNVTGRNLAASGGMRHLNLAMNSERHEQELRQIADAILLFSRLSTVRGRAVTHGTGAVRPGMVLQVDGAGARFNGPVVISGISHRVSDGTWTSEITFGLEPAETNRYGYLHGYGTVCGLEVGVVTSLEDPRSEDRVQVRIPAGDPSSNGQWMRISRPGAGNNRGFVFRPEIGDEVIVGRYDGNPQNRVLTGMLHSRQRPLPEPFLENQTSGYYSTSGLTLLFNDEDETIHLTTPGGQSVTLSDDPGQLKLADAYGNRIELNKNGITIHSSKRLTLKAESDLQIAGMNIHAKALSGLKAEGIASAELSSSGITDVKGSLVKIN